MKIALSTLTFAVWIALPGTGISDEFRFPGGDSEAGREVFEQLNCIQCHRVSGVKLKEPKERRLGVSLGSELRFVKNYGDIVKAISNPQHVVKERYANLLNASEASGEISALMPDFTDKMSVRQLMDLVAFLDKVYREGVDDYGKAQ
jgi:hypothetical protein